MLKKRSWTIEYVFTPCTCGRAAYDFKDLAVIMEEDGLWYGGPKGTARVGGRSKVVCLRKGCKGAKKSARLYVAGLPRIMNFQYLAIKKEQGGSESATNPG
jgi:hypothetical protein